ncbi:Interferon-related developmental regulator 1 [Phytophthora citrophthora]|uniref:Interferon-related developmental regulator 1 n=1 Tax=Phytophthora citrophthora TaxID=4793 RepID=A0AAD9GJ36_9STRA|nr:Interferon-related developmental regulator 1 [Phytophthora citrophthora]
MGKKRGGSVDASLAAICSGGRRMRHEEEEDDDVASIASVETRGTFVSDDGEFYDGYSKNVDDEQEIEEAIEELTEKRTTTRVAALEKLTTHLLQYLAPEDISESFLDNVLGCLRKPSEGEAVLGSRILAIMAIIFGEDEERFFQRSKNVMKPLIKTAKNAKIKVSTIRALGLICFVCSVEQENTEELLELFETFFAPKIIGDICKAALDSWGLVASSLSEDMLVNEQLLERLVPKFLALLDHKDVEVRSAAGENVAFLYESAQNYDVPLPYGEEILDRFLELSKDNSKKNSKKDRKTQRVVFRDIHSTLATGETPHISFSVKSEMLEISSWKSVKQFEAMKECLQTGLQEHIKYNNILRAMLDLPETLEDRKVDRRDVFDKKSASRKQRSNELKGDRKRKQHMQDAFYDDGFY